MIHLLKPYNLCASDYNLKQDYFDHKSELHGIDHTYRVMVNTLIIGINENLISEARLAFFGAFIHDMSRKHDGICNQHGSDSAREKLPKFSSFFEKMGVNTLELSSIANAVKFHSKSNEINKSDKDFTITSILKDADALDRVRLGYGEPNEKYLRFPETKRYIYFAHQLLEATPDNGFKSFEETVQIAENLLNTNTYW